MSDEEDIYSLCEDEHDITHENRNHIEENYKIMRLFD